MSVGEISSTKQVREPLSNDAGPNWQSRCINGLLWLLPIKRRLASAAAVREHMPRLALRPASYEPTGLGRGVEVALTNVAGWPVYHTAPSANPDTGNYVLFLHGGGYINEIVRAHWRFVTYLTRQARVRCVVPIYPLAPHATAKDVVPATGELLRKLLSAVVSKRRCTPFCPKLLRSPGRPVRSRCYRSTCGHGAHRTH